MSLGWVIAGSVAEVTLAFFLFMLGAFAGGGIANGNNLSKFHMAVLDFSLLALPASCIISGGIVVYFYNTGGNAMAYWWYAVPLVLTGLYLGLAVRVPQK